MPTLATAARNRWAAFLGPDGTSIGLYEGTTGTGGA